MVYLLQPTFFIPDNFIEGFVCVILLTIGSILTKKIDVLGAIVGGLLTLLTFLGFNFAGIGLIFIFFVLGSLVSYYKKTEKQKLGLEQENKGKRSYVHALSNAGVAGFLGLCAWILPEFAFICQVLMCASMCCALSDTFSSELGNIFGKRYFNILTLKPDKRGNDGAISLEGTLFGVLGALLMTIYSMIVLPNFEPYLAKNDIYYIGFGIFFSGFAGNLMDSVLGASLQKKGFLNNHSVNFFSTLFAAFLGFICFMVFVFCFVPVI